ncbi:hypothetical protein TREMEDRAFT_59332 [Tremella mesenterica DSM 1558]|uniref:uncharacterized protein n=1 Tax=Tremella mesenterica (strain ATCC 24925 / CBS 8224 / DSM 1558 / NBRC 9311 / NRRL Y-6157 / RJB 2259-6 / UBC 559-6) TaxID=578456 RepID=UPI0003F4A05A|nr:uncharacterized protein TREMEDRAFT_59332 [Tremella mesenterica DSM 1558]EIW73169.1 hypothetical protein TREMEDRAFT_59332 [Tremella mesenterica DSM 1558]
MSSVESSPLSSAGLPTPEPVIEYGTETEAESQAETEVETITISSGTETEGTDIKEMESEDSVSETEFLKATEDSSVRYDVDFIHDYNRKTKRWLVHWSGFPCEDDSWEPLSVFDRPYTLIYLYHKQSAVPLPSFVPPMPTSLNLEQEEEAQEEEEKEQEEEKKKEKEKEKEERKRKRAYGEHVDDLPKMRDEFAKKEKYTSEEEKDTVTSEGHSNSISGLLEGTTPVTRRTHTQRRAYHHSLIITARHEAHLQTPSAYLPQLLGLDHVGEDIILHLCQPDPSRLHVINNIITTNLHNPNCKGFISLPEITKALRDNHLSPLIQLRAGFNILVDKTKGEEGEVFGVVYYRNLKHLSQSSKNEALNIMRVVDLISRTNNNIIKTNGASHAKESKAIPHGVMAEYGWRNSFVPGEGITRYKPKQGKGDQLEEIDLEMPKVADYFDRRFKILFQAAFNATQRHAEDNHIPRFDVQAIDSGLWKNTPGANMFSTTRGGFSNTPHQDRDTSPFNIGLFFAGAVREGRFSGDLSRVSKQLHGGEFWWPELGVVVGHAPTDGWAEVVWRGPTDLHGTLSCWLHEGAQFSEVDRWGSSCQITGAFQNSVRLMRERRDSRLM